MILYCLVLHFIADFLLQSREMGKQKSVNKKYLLEHLAIQFGVLHLGLLVPVAFGVISIQNASCISLLNTLVHGIIDWNIWRFYKVNVKYRINRRIDAGGRISEKLRKTFFDNEVKTWKYWEDHWFYVTIGADQLLHTATIVFLVERFT